MNWISLRFSKKKKTKQIERIKFSMIVALKFSCRGLSPLADGRRKITKAFHRNNNNNRNLKQVKRTFTCTYIKLIFPHRTTRKLIRTKRTPTFNPYTAAPTHPFLTSTTPIRGTATRHFPKNIYRQQQFLHLREWRDGGPH